MIFQVPRFEQSHCKTRQFLLWCEIHCINKITGSGTYSILCFFNLEYKRASLPRITKVYNLFKASGLERYPVQDVR